MEHSTGLAKPTVRKVIDNGYYQLIHNGPIPEIKYDNFSDSINNWYKNVDIKQNGKIVISLSRSLGALDNEQASINITLETTRERIGDFKVIHIDNKTFVEVSDKQGKTCPEFKDEEQYYTREYKDSSIVTGQVFLDSLISSLNDLIKDPKVDQYINKIKEEVGDIRREYKREWRTL